MDISQDVRNAVVAKIAETYPQFEVQWEGGSDDEGYPARQYQVYDTAKKYGKFVDWADWGRHLDTMPTVDEMAKSLVEWSGDGDLQFLSKQEVERRNQEAENARLEQANRAIDSLRIEAPVGSAEWFQAIESAIAVARDDQNQA